MRRKIDLLSRPDTGWVDRPERGGSASAGTVIRADGSSIPVAIANLSNVGCCIESDERFDIGERLRISIARLGTVPSQIRWTVNGRAGARFDAPTD